MKRSLKAMVACAAFALCMSATMIVSFAATDLKIDPVALVAYAQDAASAEDGVSVSGGELFIGLDTGSYTFADVADSLTDYGLQYEVSDGVYVIGGAITLGTAGAFEDQLSAAAVYCYNVVGDGYQPVIVTIATKNAEEVASVIVAGASDIAQNGLPEIPEEVTDTLTDIYGNIVGVVPDIFYNIQEQLPGAVSEIVDSVTEGYSDVIDDATKALENVSPENVQNFIDTTADEIADTVGNVIDDVTGAIGDVDPDALLADLWAFLFS